MAVSVAVLLSALFVQRFFCNVGKSGAIWEGRCVVICGGDLVFNAHGAGAVTAAWGVFGGAELPVSSEDIGRSPS